MTYPFRRVLLIDRKEIPLSSTVPTSDIYGNTARQLEQLLEPSEPPIALAFVDERPAGVPALSQSAPSACSLWPAAQSNLFYATAEQHANCPLGAHVMGLGTGDSVRDALKAVVEKMCGCEYIDPEEAGNIPTVQRHASGVVYGPLASFPMPADVVLMWLRPSRAMLYQEASGATSWEGDRVSRLLGRPGCAALPVAPNEATPVLSAGCIGMRTFTKVGDEVLLAAVPVGRLEDFIEALQAAHSANEAMREYYRSREEMFG